MLTLCITKLTQCKHKVSIQGCSFLHNKVERKITLVNTKIDINDFENVGLVEKLMHGR